MDDKLLGIVVLGIVGMGGLVFLPNEQANNLVIIIVTAICALITGTKFGKGA